MRRIILYPPVFSWAERLFPLKPKLLMVVAVCLLAIQGCEGTLLPWRSFSPGEKPVETTPLVYVDTVFSGYAFIDANQNGVLDESDPPLPGATFQGMGFGSQTDQDGYAMILIPGEWNQSFPARMAAPEGSGYTLIGTPEQTLQNGVKNRADFLFALPKSVDPLSPVLPASGAVQKDLTYCVTPEEVALKMDLYPAETGSPPYPVVVYIHGGGWTSGDKQDEVGRIFRSLLVQRGFLFVSINYRLAPEYIFPAAIQDVKCALRSLRANAARYRLDPDRIGVLGDSAGGHLAALLATADESAGWDQGEYLHQSSRVQAVVDLYGPADLPALFDNSVGPLLPGVFGALDSDDPLLERYSPTAYVHAKAPPFLILHGDQDELVPLEQSQTLSDRLQAVGVPVELVVVKNAAHGFQPVNGEIEPDFRRIFEKIGDFFDEYLK